MGSSRYRAGSSASSPARWSTPGTSCLVAPYHRAGYLLPRPLYTGMARWQSGRACAEGCGSDSRCQYHPGATLGPSPFLLLGTGGAGFVIFMCAGATPPTYADIVQAEHLILRRRLRVRVPLLAPARFFVFSPGNLSFSFYNRAGNKHLRPHALV